MIVIRAVEVGSASLAVALASANGWRIPTCRASALPARSVELLRPLAEGEGQRADAVDGAGHLVAGLQEPPVGGTDAGSPAVGHEVIAPEMEFMVQVGVKRDNYDAVRSATSVAAAISDRADRLGTLEAGKLADVVVVDGDPQQDLYALERVRMTYVDGRRHV